MQNDEITKPLDKGIDDWRVFLNDHWRFGLIMVAGIAAAITGAVFVFLWRADLSPATLGTPTNIGDWTVGFIFSFFLDVLLWEFLIIGLATIAGLASAFGIWWMQLPDEKKEKYKASTKKNKRKHPKTRDGGGGLVSLITTIIWLVIVWQSGYWDVPFSAWAFSIFIDLMLWTFLWFLIICGIPLLIGGIWWLRKEIQKV